jgi:hypothetical protein
MHLTLDFLISVEPGNEKRLRLVLKGERVPAILLPIRGVGSFGRAHPQLKGGRSGREAPESIRPRQACMQAWRLAQPVSPAYHHWRGEGRVARGAAAVPASACGGGTGLAESHRLRVVLERALSRGPTDSLEMHQKFCGGPGRPGDPGGIRATGSVETQSVTKPAESPGGIDHRHHGASPGRQFG